MPWWLWLVLGLGLMGAELASSGGFYLIFFGVAGVLLGLLTLLGLAGPLWTQWLIFTLLSVTMLLAFRSPLLRLVQTRSDDVDSMIGEIAVPLDAIAPGGVGRAELRGSAWAARNLHSASLEKGQRCRVQRVDGLTISLLPE